MQRLMGGTPRLAALAESPPDDAIPLQPLSIRKEATTPHRAPAPKRRKAKPAQTRIVAPGEAASLFAEEFGSPVGAASTTELFGEFFEDRR